VRLIATSVLSLAAVLALAPPASAHGVITRQGDVLTYTATNNCSPVPCPSTLVISAPETGVLQFEDTTSTGGIFWGPCTPVNETRTRCDASTISRIDVVFDHNDDSLTASITTPLQVSGGPGNDRLSGGFGADLLDGGDGADAIVGGAGSDMVLGGPGDDAIDVRDGLPDSVNCGDGIDAVSADQTDPTDLSSAFGCESVSVENAPPPGPPPDTPPDTTITKSPRRESKRDGAKFKFTATEPGSSYECSRDGSPYRPCRSPKRYRNLPPGRHLFKVRAIDPAGNTDPTTASYRWRVNR
jgi:hypothetical protein